MFAMQSGLGGLQLHYRDWKNLEKVGARSCRAGKWWITAQVAVCCRSARVTTQLTRKCWKFLDLGSRAILLQAVWWCSRSHFFSIGFNFFNRTQLGSIRTQQWWSPPGCWWRAWWTQTPSRGQFGFSLYQAPTQVQVVIVIFHGVSIVLLVMLNFK